MNEKQLQYCILAARLGSFTKAAAESYLTTSALVQQVNLLEADLGFRIFERGRAGVALTAEGAEFIPRAEGILRMMEGARSPHPTACGAELKIGVEHSEVADFLTQICEICRTAHPELRFTFFSTETADQPRCLAEGKSDLFVAPDYLPLLEGQSLHPMYLDGYRLCVPQGSRLAGMEYARPEDVAGERVYMEPFMCGPGTPLSALLPYVSEGMLVDAPFNVSVPSAVSLNSGVLPRLDRCSQVWCPPLASVPLDVRRSRVGIVCADSHPEPVDWFLDAAREYFSTQPNGLL